MKLKDVFNFNKKKKIFGIWLEDGTTTDKIVAEFNLEINDDLTGGSGEDADISVNSDSATMKKIKSKYPNFYYEKINPNEID